MTAMLIDGAAEARRLRQEIARQVTAFPQHDRPGLAVVLVGDDPASGVYVRSKARMTAEVGMNSIEHRLPASTEEAELLNLIDQLNRDEAVDGILVQLPLPPSIDPLKVIQAIDPSKDVDGFHPQNAGALATGMSGLVPCTPRGALHLLKTARENLSGLSAVIVGRSNIVGKPMAHLLLAENCTVTLAHSRSINLPDIVRQADIVVAAVGRPEFIRGSWLKPGAIVIDVGINRISEAGAKDRIVGDVAFAEASNVVSALTPVPGGVGPMTIAYLLQNTLDAARRRRCAIGSAQDEAGSSL